MVVDDLDHHLARGDRAQHLLADRLVADAGDEILDYRQGDVGLEQGDAHLAQGRVDVGFRERAAPGQLIEDRAEAFLQTVEHHSSVGLTQPVRRRGRPKDGARQCAKLADWRGSPELPREAGDWPWRERRGP